MTKKDAHKIGRNELCPCGSGKKSKNCGCGRQFITCGRDPEADAYHEASHAVFGVIFDFAIEFATVVPFISNDGEQFVGTCNFKASSELGPGGYLTGARSSKWLLVQLAGCVVEWHRGTLAFGTLPLSDSRNVDQIVNQLPEALREIVIEKAVEQIQVMISHPPTWKAITRIAEMLLNKDRLDGDEIKREVLAVR